MGKEQEQVHNIQSRDSNQTDYKLIRFLAVTGLAAGITVYSLFMGSRDNTGQNTEPLPTPTPTPIVKEIRAIFKKSSTTGQQYYGPPTLIASCEEGDNAWQIHYLEPTQGIGFYESSSGINDDPRVRARLYASRKVAPGIYKGRANVECLRDTDGTGNKIASTTPVGYEIKILP